MKHIGVIGAGTMGNGIAHVFAQSGYSVKLIDLSEKALENALSTIENNLNRMLSKEKISKDEKDKTLANIVTSTDLPTSVKGLDLVVEAATENIDIKLQLFSQLDELCDDSTILGTNTSSISSPKLPRLPGAEKVIGMHFMNPVPVMKLVEVIVVMLLPMK